MKVTVYENKEGMGAAAACNAADGIRIALASKGYANIILATGASQFEMLSVLATIPDIDWSCVNMFHLDEYIGLDITHPASFRKYLTERFIDRVSVLKEAHLIDGNTGDPHAECKRVGDIIKNRQIDVACVGIGENGHLAFNDPPADFETETPYLVVQLDKKCREQQMGEGWFSDLDSVPRQAISMSVRQIMKSSRIVVTVPDKRKAEAVRNTLKKHITPEFPASILRSHHDCKLFIDKSAASSLA